MTENLLKRRKKKGFTLIELIVVIAIIAIIALIAIPKVIGYQDSAKKKADVANAKSIATTVATEIANGHIPTSDAIAGSVAKQEGEGDTGLTKANYYITKNMQSIPKQQYGNSDASFYLDIDTNGNVKVFTDSGKATQLYPDVNSNYK